jgi:hypothetical protein
LKKQFQYWKNFVRLKDNNRITFYARQDIETLFDSLSNGDGIDNQEISENTKTIFEAINIIEEYFNENAEKAEVLSKYIFEHTRIIGVCLNYDNKELNRYFEVMNNRGVQLEKHEILKARLLSGIPDRKKQSQYAVIWDACSQMNLYIEDGFRNVKASAIKPLVQKSVSVDNFLKFLATDRNETEGKTLKNIFHEIRTADLDENNNQKSAIKDNEKERFRSICTFSDFLLHVYKLYSGDYTNVKIVNKDLLDIIHIPATKAVEFIDLLLYYRIIFDNCIVKRAESETHDFKYKIRRLKKSESTDNIVRVESETLKGLEQIQSMLLVSTELVHWLTPLLKYLSENSFNPDKLTRWLESLDNKLALVRIKPKCRLLDTADEILRNTDSVNNTQGLEYNESWIKQDKTERYWFFKLDYCLLKEFQKNGNKEIAQYRFRPSNSLEHVHAQS